MRKEFIIGMLIFAASLTAKQFITVPELIMGFALGLALCLFFIGSLSENAYQKLKQFKRSLIKHGRSS